MLIIFPNRSDRICGSNQPLFSGYSGPFSGVKWLGLDVAHSPPASVEIRMRGTITPPPLRVIMLSTRTNLFSAESQTKWLRNSLRPGRKNNFLSFHKRPPPCHIFNQIFADHISKIVDKPV